MKKKGPDSLEGLLIAIVTCLISTLMFGTIELSSMLFVACIERYRTNRNNASFPFMLSNVLQAMTGPLAGYLAQRFSVRCVVFAGSVLSFLGVAGCYFAEDITLVTLLWGIVFGTGLGFATLLLPVVINDYFIEQRSKALGVCYVGSPIGFFIFPSVLEVLMDKYGLSGSFLLLAGINMHCIPLSMLLTRPKFAARDDKSVVDTVSCPEPTDQKSSVEALEIPMNSDHNCCESNKISNALCSNFGIWPPSDDVICRRENGECPKPENGVFKHYECKQIVGDFRPRELGTNSGTWPRRDGENRDLRNGEIFESRNSVFKHHECEQMGVNFQPRALGTNSGTLLLRNGVISCRENGEYSEPKNNVLEHHECEQIGDNFRLHPLGTNSEARQQDGANRHRENGECPEVKNVVLKQQECEQIGDNFQPRALGTNSETQPPHDGANRRSENGECPETKNNEFEQIGDNFQPRTLKTPKHVQFSTSGDDCQLTLNHLVKTEPNFHSYCGRAIVKCGKSDRSLLDPPGTPVLLKYLQTDACVNGDAVKNARAPDETTKTKRSLLDLYRDPVFALICLINGLTNLNFGTLSTVIIDFGRDHQTFPEHDKYIMMCISVTGVVGMLGFGWVTDGGHMTRTRFASLTLVVGCACLLLMPETSGFLLLAVPLSVFCVCQSSFFPLIPAITAEHIEEEFQEVAISACNVLSGPMYFIIPPLIGHFRDGKGSYDNIFYFMAGLSIVNSVSVFAIPYLARWRDNRTKAP